MRKFMFLFFLFISFCIFSQDNDSKGGGQNLDKDWLKAKKKVRYNFGKNELAELDMQTLNDISNSTIPPEMEPDLADLLADILKDSTLYGKENAVKALQILYGQFKNKINFYNVATQFTYQSKKKEAFIVAEIYIGLKNTIEGNLEDNIRAFRVIYETTRPMYIIGYTNGTVPYGTEKVLANLIAYLREFIKLAAGNKIVEDAKTGYMIATVIRDLKLEEDHPNFMRIPGAKELKQEYFFFSDSKKTKQ